MAQRKHTLRENRPWPENPTHLELVDRTIRFNGHWGISSTNQKPEVPPERVSEIYGTLRLYPGAPTLPALRRVKGDVSVEPGQRQRSDISEQVPSLQEIAGQLRVLRQSRFRELKTVSKSLALGHLADLPKLNIVGENLEIVLAPQVEGEQHFPSLRVIGKDILGPKEHVLIPYRPVLVGLPALKAVGGLIHEYGLALELGAQPPHRSIGDAAFAIYRAWLEEERHLHEAAATIGSNTGDEVADRTSMGL